MRSKIVGISNVTRLLVAGQALLNRSCGMPGMGLCYGDSGLGKTTAIAWLATQQHGVYVRAMATSTPTSLLDTITRELNIAPRARVAQTVEAIVVKLAESGRPLFVDEADYVVEQPRLINTLRDLHDLSSSPVILIGMAGIDRLISKSPQLSGRMAQWVKFEPCTPADARNLAKELCEITVAADLVAELHRRAAGSVRNITVGLGRIEQFAKAKGMKGKDEKAKGTKAKDEEEGDVITLADWPTGEDFFLGGARKAA